MANWDGTIGDTPSLIASPLPVPYNRTHSVSSIGHGESTDHGTSVLPWQPKAPFNGMYITSVPYKVPDPSATASKNRDSRYTYTFHYDQNFPDILQDFGGPAMVTLDFQVEILTPANYVAVARDIFINISLETVIMGFKDITLYALAGGLPSRYIFRYITAGALTAGQGFFRHCEFKVNIETQPGQYTTAAYPLRVKASLYCDLTSLSAQLKPAPKEGEAGEEESWVVV